MRILAAPFDGGGAQLGSRLGPEAIKLANLEDELARVGQNVSEWVRLKPHEGDSSSLGLRNFAAFFQCFKDLQHEVQITLEKGEFPLVLGGEHSLALGSISGALHKVDPASLAVLWIDAHADFNTPGSSNSGNLHGMPLAALCGFDSECHGPEDLQWKSILPARPISSHQIGWLGLRDVDLGEKKRLAAEKASPCISMFDIDREGLAPQVEKIDAWLRQGKFKHLWISFDVDVMDPILAPGTGTAVRGGLTYREAHMLAELLCQALHESHCPYQLFGLDVVEVNPLQDSGNQTAKMAVEWICSLFGKTILGSSWQ